MLVVALTTLMLSGVAVASTSIMSLSDSLAGSIEGSSSSVKHSSYSVDLVAEGDYKVVDVAQAQDASGRMRLTLQPVASVDDQDDIYLYVQGDQYARVHPRLGDIVSAKMRPYGAAFFMQGKGDPFVLVFRDGWSDQIQAQPVTL